MKIAIMRYIFYEHPSESLGEDSEDLEINETQNEILHIPFRS